MNILITGACGFIGSHLVKALQAHRLFLIDDLSTGQQENLEDLNYEKLYISDYFDQDVLDEIFSFKIDAIVHLAAIASVQKCNDFPEKANLVNHLNVIALIKRAKKEAVHKFVFASSAAVYGDEKTLPKTENSIIKPISLYGEGKYNSEHYLMQESNKDFKTYALRFFNVFGPKQDPNSPYSGVLSIFSNLIFSEDKNSLTIYGDGEQTRDFVSVHDVCSFIQYCIEAEVDSDVYNVASGRSISLNSIVALMEKVKAKKISCNYKEARKNDIKYSSADNSKLLATNYKLKYSFEDAFKDYIKSVASKS